MARKRGELTITVFYVVKNVVGNVFKVSVFVFIGFDRFINMPVKRANG